MKKKDQPNINNLSTKPRFNIGDLVLFDNNYSREYVDETHAIVIESVGSVVKVRPLTNFNRIEICNAADCRLAPKIEK